MEISFAANHFGYLDIVSVALLVFSMLAIGHLIELENAKHPSVSILMANYRREWMVQFLSRQPRVFDASILTSLRQGTSFFASTCLIAIGGGMALIGNTDSLSAVAQDFSIASSPKVVWEIKILLVVGFLANALLKFIWAHRLFGYCAVVLASVPNDEKEPMAMSRAMKAGEINITAAKSFNRGLRSIYFAMGSLAWLVGPLALIFATLVTVTVLLRREFASHSRSVLLSEG